MANVQRKLVHKQFNSPIGLYSDNNVKATLNRELKVLSNGTMGIDFDDNSKPVNLANSAVLRMLQEEENQQRHGRQPDSSHERKSRPRIREIDRATVLSINRKLACRCTRARELSWPPLNNKNERGDKIKLFSEQLYAKHSIKNVCRKFDENAHHQNNNVQNPKKILCGSSVVRNNYGTDANTLTLPIISISDIDINDHHNPDAAASNNHNNDPIESISENPYNTTSDYKRHTSDIDSIETIKPFSDGKIATINNNNNNNNSPHRVDKDRRKVALKRSKSYDDIDNTISNIIANEINNRKNTNLHFIGYSEWLRCSSYNELAKWKNCINYVFPSQHPPGNSSEKSGKTIKMQVHQTDGCYYCDDDDNMSENKYENVFKIKLISPGDAHNVINRPVQSDECMGEHHHHHCCNCGRCWCGRIIFKYSDNDRNRFLDENSRIDIEKNDFICCNSSDHICSTNVPTEWMGCIGRGNESENNCFFNVNSIMERPKRRSDGRNDGGLKRVAWPPEPEYQSPSGVAPQPQQSPAQANTYHQPSQNQYPSQYNNNARQQSHDSPAVQQRSPYRPEQPVYPQPTYQQQHTTQSYPNQQSQPSYDHQPTAVDNHPQPIYQRQHSQSLPRQSRMTTPGRQFANPDPCFMDITKPGYLQPTAAKSGPAVPPSTSAFAGGVAVNVPQHQSPSQYQSPRPTGYANGGASPQYQPQSSPTYQPQQSQPSPNYYPLPQQQPQSSPQYQSSSSLPLSPDPNRSLPGWSPVRKPVQVSSGYTLNNQRPSAEPYSGQSYAGNQNQYQQQPSPSYQPQPSANYNQYQPSQAPQQQQQYQPQQQQQYQSTPSNEPQYQAQQPYYRQPSPGIITLRKEAPFNQEPAPVFTSSPSAASFGGGTNMRGDQKWPPQEYKLQSEIDNEARRRLAQGPVLRPRRVQKDYSQFFNQHALNSTYPAYRAPPGTQHFPAH